MLAERGHHLLEPGVESFAGRALVEGDRDAHDYEMECEGAHLAIFKAERDGG